ncbi:MAG: DUF2693 domain-containing protein [Alphaproteobacteria bacterium]|jgi:hypothetical protein|nr:DUF2693 domain-containing protein [Alphaproteobacteria bacterium]
MTTTNNNVTNIEMSKTMRSIMSLAWTFVKQHNMSMSDALKCAWANAKLHFMMRDGFVNFQYIKKDGSVRDAKGTTRLDILPNGALKGGMRTTDPKRFQVYYDDTKKAWRCFDRSRLVKIG